MTRGKSAEVSTTLTKQPGRLAAEIATESAYAICIASIYQRNGAGVGNSDAAIAFCVEIQTSRRRRGRVTNEE